MACIYKFTRSLAHRNGVRFYATDPSRVLGIKPGADKAEIRKGYLRQARIWHPDNHATRSDAEQELAQSKFREVREAYEFLLDTQSNSNKYGRQQSAHRPNNDTQYTYERYETQTKEQEEWMNKKRHGAIWTFRTLPAVIFGILCYLWWDTKRSNEKILLEKGRLSYQYDDLQKKKQKHESPYEDPYKKRMREAISVERNPDKHVSKHLDVMSNNTGVQPIRTGYGWDYTNVYAANKNMEAHAQKKEAQRINYDRQQLLHKVKENERAQEIQLNVEQNREARIMKYEKAKQDGEKKAKKKSRKQKISELRGMYNEIIVNLEKKCTELGDENEELRMQNQILLDKLNKTGVISPIDSTIISNSLPSSNLAVI